MEITVKVENMKSRPYYQSKVMRGVGRMENPDNSRKAYRDDVRLELERAQLIYESYQQTEGLPFITRRAKAFEYLFSKKALYILPDELIVGNICSKPGHLQTFPEKFGSWLDKALEKSYAGLISDEDKLQLKRIHKYFKNMAVHGMEKDYLPPDLKPYWSYPNHGVFMWLHGGHVGVPNYEKVFQIGLNGLIEEIEAQLKSIMTEDYAYSQTRDFVERKRFYDATLITLRAMVAYGKRFAEKCREEAEAQSDPVRKNQLMEIAEICEWVPGNPPRTLHEALQMYWFINLGARILDLQSSGLGERVDQLFYPFYKADVDAERLDFEKAVELYGHVVLKMNEEPELKPPAQGAGGATLVTRVTTIGGQKADGTDATNEMTFVIMEAKNRIGLIQPAIAVRLHEGTPDSLWDKVVDSLLREPGVYSFFNDNMMYDYLKGIGVPEEDVWNYSTDGCMRWQMPGKAIGHRALGGYFALPKCLEYALNQGKDEKGNQIGVATPDPLTFTSTEDVVKAYLEQFRFFAKHLITLNNIVDVFDEEYYPQPFLSSMMDGCIDAGMDCRKFKYFANSLIQPVGQVTVANSIAALDSLVFKNKKVEMTEVLAALRNNWEGKEALRQEFLNAPKFGNDITEVDELAADIYLRTTQVLRSFKNIHGNSYNEDGTGAASYFMVSGLTGATPDGRRAGDLFADGTVSPAPGTDIAGPTAALKSVAAIDHKNTFTHLYNQKWLPQYLREHKDEFISYFKVWVKLGVHHIQFNVIKKDDLIKAQENPDDYSTLVVRQAGLAAYFVDLEKMVQDEIINRTEQGGL
ncbi:MAG: hypothetical protein GXY34_10225 [Syntrophomonadaceae bacterium]|nr:hypothetical protein [Syntrophomonadaceae bacterium]